MILNKKIFRAYDIRGEAFKDFDEDGFFVTAAAFGRYIKDKFNLKNPRIFVAGDGRQSMPELWPAVVGGLESVGAEVVWGGTITSPMNYFYFNDAGFNATVQITASHNPAKDNGLKFMDKNGSVCGAELQKIAKMAECTKCLLAKDMGICDNNCQKVDFFAEYLEKLQEITPKQKLLNIVVDAGNGVAGLYYPQILREFGHNVIELYCDLDTTFPNHQPDPERVENLQDLIQKTRENKADFGFAFDGDGDRIGIVSKEGEIFSADKIMYILAADFLSRNPGESIVIDAMSSTALAEKIREIGGKPVFSKTGHSYIEEKMHEIPAKLGGEQSGHFMFGENFYGHDDAILAGLRFITAIQSFPQLLAETLVHWPTLLEFSEKFSVPDEEKFEILEKIRGILVEKYPDADTTDGVRVEFGNLEWGIIRCSNTSPKISIRIEARDEKSLAEKKEILVGVLKRFVG